jgi:hypothetical protein
VFRHRVFHLNGRRNPDRYAIIYDSKYDNNDNVSVLLKLQLYHPPLIRLLNPLKTTITMNTILEIASSFLKILLKQTVDKTMVAAVKEDKSA